jgi:hypothetical protein
VKYHTVQINGLGPGIQQQIYGRPDHRGTLLHFLPTFLSGYLMRIWGGTGLADVPSPGPAVIWGWFFLVLLGVVVALLLKRGRHGRLAALVLVSAPILTTLVVADGSFGTNRQWSAVFAGVQGRYLYNTIVAISALAVIGWVQLTDRRVHAYFVPVVLVAAIVTNATVWVMILRSWYQPLSASGAIHGFTTAFHGLLRWSPLPSPVTILLVLVLPGITTVLAVAAAIRDARSFGAATLVPVRSEPPVPVPV